MAFDPSKDKVIAKRTQDDLEVSVCSYNNGPAKIQISRYYRDEWIKLGRLSFDEAAWVVKAIQELMSEVLIEAMKKSV